MIIVLFFCFSFGWPMRRQCTKNTAATTKRKQQQQQQPSILYSCLLLCVYLQMNEFWIFYFDFWLATVASSEKHFSSSSSCFFSHFGCHKIGLIQIQNENHHWIFVERTKNNEKKFMETNLWHAYVSKYETKKTKTVAIMNETEKFCFTEKQKKRYEWNKQQQIIIIINFADD